MTAKELWNSVKWGVVVLTIATLIVMAQQSDYTEAVMMDMPTETYKVMHDVMPDKSDSDLMKMYVGNEEYWDQYAENYEKREEW